MSVKVNLKFNSIAPFFFLEFAKTDTITNVYDSIFKTYPDIIKEKVTVLGKNILLHKSSLTLGEIDKRGLGTVLFTIALFHTGGVGRLN
jgi:hypothetical protein